MEPSIFKFGLTAEQLQTIEKKHKEAKGDTELIVKELLCEERERPLLVIYPIDLKSNYDKDINNEGIEKQIDPQKEEKKAALNGNLLFAFAVGFPKKESSERLVYRANMQKIKELTDGIEVDDDEEVITGLIEMFSKEAHVSIPNYQYNHIKSNLLAMDQSDAIDLMYTVVNKVSQGEVQNPIGYLITSIASVKGGE